MDTAQKFITAQQAKANFMPASATTWATTPTDNTIYNLGEIASLTISALPTINTQGVVVKFTASSSWSALAYPAATPWSGTDAPSVEAGKTYCITILDGICSITEVTPQTQTATTAE